MCLSETLEGRQTTYRVLEYDAHGCNSNLDGNYYNHAKYILQIKSIMLAF